MKMGGGAWRDAIRPTRLKAGLVSIILGMGLAGWSGKNLAENAEFWSEYRTDSMNAVYEGRHSSINPSELQVQAEAIKRDCTYLAVGAAFVIGGLLACWPRTIDTSGIMKPDKEYKGPSFSSYGKRGSRDPQYDITNDRWI